MKTKAQCVIGKAASVLSLVTIFLCAASGPSYAQSPSEFTVHVFTQGGPLGSNPSRALITDSSGNLYGTAANGGVNRLGAVFELIKPVAPNTKWTEQVLYSFAGGTADGSFPLSELVFDASGNLYGTTDNGGTTNVGTVFKLTPVSGGAWSEQVIYNFKGTSSGGGDGANPGEGVAIDSTGDLYGVTQNGGAGCGIVYQLVPPSTSGGSWTENILFQGTQFLGCNPFNTPVLDATGHLFGTTGYGGHGNGVVFRLTPPSTTGGPWSYRILYNSGATSNDAAFFRGIILHGGNLYGVSAGGGLNGMGTIFELVRPPSGSTTWTYSTLYSFGASATDGTMPNGHPIFDKLGNLWGATQFGGGNGTSLCGNRDCGTVYQLAPGSGGWTESVVHAFAASSKDGIYPYGTLVLAPNGVLYGTTNSSVTGGGGIVFGVKRF